MLDIASIIWLGFVASSELPQSVATRQIRVALALVIGAVAAWPGKSKGFFISLVALLWITLEYILWWKQSVGALDAAGMSFSHVRHFAYLLRGTWWDLCMLLATIIDLVWAGKHLRHAYYQSQDSISDAGPR